jgi:phosphatidylglycerophosphate synthase
MRSAISSSKFPISFLFSKTKNKKMPASTPGSSEDILMYRHTRVIADCLCGKMRANTVTTLNFIPSSLLVWAVYMQNVPLTVLFVVVRMFLDDLDGEVARRCDDKTEFGHYYEHILDMLTGVGVATAYGYTFFGSEVAFSLFCVAVATSAVAYYLMFECEDKHSEKESTASKVVRFVCDDNPTVVFSVSLALLLIVTKRCLG